MSVCPQTLIHVKLDSFPAAIRPMPTLIYMTPADTLISQTRNWLRDVIIAQGFCPFAKREYDLGRIHYAVIETADLEGQLERIIAECEALDTDANRETSLLIFADGLSDFEIYLDLLDIATALLKAQDYEGVYQLASFHPDYRFAEVGENDPSHYTNRAPHPVIHILREASVEAVLKTYPDPENIPQRNIDHARALGLTAMQDLLKACIQN